MKEFDLIKRYFTKLNKVADDVVLGVGDDAAILRSPDEQLDLVVCVDTLVSGVHFLPDTAPADIGYKALAVNLSDIAAMGATPRWITLALTLPQGDETWVAGFCSSMSELIDQFDLNVIGGNTTQGPLNISVQVIGTLPRDRSLRRANAKVGDLILVSGTLGDAGLGLAMLQKKIPPIDTAIQKHLRPTPRVALGQALLPLANSAIDISDGLLSDLNHILHQSQIGASINVDTLPFSAAMRTMPIAKARSLALSAGDDYELCFTLPPKHLKHVMTLANDLNCPCTTIGKIEATPGLRLLDEQGDTYVTPEYGFEHFTQE